MQMAAYRTLLFRLHRSHSYVRESSVHATYLPLLVWSLFLLPLPLLSLSLSLVFSKRTHVHRGCVCNYEHAEATASWGMEMHRLCVNASQRQFHERPRHNFAVNQVFSAIIRGLSWYIPDRYDRSLSGRKRSNLTTNIV